MLAVPWAVYSPSTDLNVLTVTVDRDRICSAPVFDWGRIDEYSRPDYITDVYSYYRVSPGAAVGVGVSAVLQRRQREQPRQRGPLQRMVRQQVRTRRQEQQQARGRCIVAGSPSPTPQQGEEHTRVRPRAAGAAAVRARETATPTPWPSRFFTIKRTNAECETKAGAGNAKWSRQNRNAI